MGEAHRQLEFQKRHHIGGGKEHWPEMQRQVRIHVKNYSLPPQKKRLLNLIKTLPSDYFDNLPKQVVFHDLCRLETAPTSCQILLGCSLKFCIHTPVPSPDIGVSLKQLCSLVRTKAYHQGKPEQDFNPKLYKKKENWNPPLVEQGNAELVLMDFSQDLIKLNKIVNKKAYHGSNLSA